MQKLVQVTQVRDVNHWPLRQAHPTTTGSVKHPLGDFEEADILVMLKAAAKYRFVPRSCFADQDLLAAPGMPGINDFTELGIMCFVLSTCSIRLGVPNRTLNFNPLVK
jgi:hypothetical protein